MVQLRSATAAMTRLAEQARTTHHAFCAAVADARVLLERSRGNLNAAQTDWDTEVDLARSRLESLRAARGTTSVEDLGELAPRVASLRSLVETLENQGEDSLSSISSRASELQELLSTRLSSAEAAMSEVNDATELLLTETEERAGTVEERLSSWASTVKASSETLAQAVDSLTEHFRGRSENHLDGSVNTSSSKIESSFLTQAIQSLETAASGVRAATSLLGNAKEEGVGEFEDSLAGLIGKIRPILDVIETIKPILELAKAIL